MYHPIKATQVKRAEHVFKATWVDDGESKKETFWMMKEDDDGKRINIGRQCFWEICFDYFSLAPKVKLHVMDTSLTEICWQLFGFVIWKPLWLTREFKRYHGLKKMNQVCLMITLIMKSKQKIDGAWLRNVLLTLLSSFWHHRKIFRFKKNHLDVTSKWRQPPKPFFRTRKKLVSSLILSLLLVPFKKRPLATY